LPLFGIKDKMIESIRDIEGIDFAIIGIADSKRPIEN
jgi:hypothetical protein